MVTTDFAGNLFRCIPHWSVEPLSAAPSQQFGGRWNAPGTFPVLYTFMSRTLARTWVDGHLARGGVTLNEAQPEALPDLLVLVCNLNGIADLASDSGLQSVGLPPQYPKGFETEAAYPTTQHVGMQLYQVNVPGVLARSATAMRWDGPVMNGSEIAIFVDYTASPVLVERISSAEWL